MSAANVQTAGKWCFAIPAVTLSIPDSKRQERSEFARARLHSGYHAAIPCVESKYEFAQAIGRIDWRQRSVTRTATILLLFAYRTELSVTPLAGDEEPDEIIRSAVKIIEDRYLYTRSNAFWNAAKERCLKAATKIRKVRAEG